MEILKILKMNSSFVFLIEQSWTSNNFGQTIKEYRENSFTDFKIVEKAGHHIYTDNAPEFNKAVLQACKVLRTQKK